MVFPRRHRRRGGSAVAGAQDRARDARAAGRAERGLAEEGAARRRGGAGQGGRSLRQGTRVLRGADAEAGVGLRGWPLGDARRDDAGAIGQLTLIGRNPAQEWLSIPLPQWGEGRVRGTRIRPTLTPTLSLCQREREKKSRAFSAERTPRYLRIRAKLSWPTRSSSPTPRS